MSPLVDLRAQLRAIRPEIDAALARVLDMEAPTSAIVFCRTRREVDELGEALRARGYLAESLLRCVFTGEALFQPAAFADGVAEA